MRRFLRWAWNGLAAASLLLSVATCVPWVRSYWAGEMLHHFDPLAGREHALFSNQGQLAAYRAVFVPGPIYGTRVEYAYVRSDQPDGLDGRATAVRRDAAVRAYGPVLGLALFLRPAGPGGSYYVEVMWPYWLAALTFALLPGWRALGWYRRRKLRGGPAFEVVSREG